jgi:outer membrane protein assembly factor BamD (BamD/ComL family)
VRRLLLIITVLSSTWACNSAPEIPEGLDDVETAAMFLDMGRDKDAANLAAEVAKDDTVSMLTRAEAAFVAGEAQLAQGNHLKAMRHYIFVLENAPWSEHSEVIEDRLFEIGEIFLYSDQYSGWWLFGLFNKRSRGVEALETVQAYFRRSDRADDALKMVAEYFVSVDEFEEAAFTFERLVDEYPDSEWVELSLWRGGVCRVKLSNGPDYQRDDLLRAQDLFQQSLRLFPKGMAAAEVRAALIEVRESLALNEIVVADFYRSRGIIKGEELRLANAFLLYPDTMGGQEARDRLLRLGVALETLDLDPSLNAVDNVRPGKLPWADR